MVNERVQPLSKIIDRESGISKSEIECKHLNRNTVTYAQFNISIPECFRITKAKQTYAVSELSLISSTFKFGFNEIPSNTRIEHQFLNLCLHFLF